MALEVERVETTRSQKILATILVIFLLIFGIRVVEKLEELPKRPDIYQLEVEYGIPELEAELWQLQQNLTKAEGVLEGASRRLQESYEEYLFRREEYRVSLEEGVVDPELEALYNQSRRAYEASKRSYKMALEVRDDIEAKIDQLDMKISEKRSSAWKDYNSEMKVYGAKVLMARMVFVIPLMIASILSFLRMKRKHSKYLLLTNSFMAFSFILVAYSVLEFVRVTAYFLLVSGIGAAISTAVLIYVIRSAFKMEKLALSRIKERKCPYCGTPVIGRYCISCGKEIVKPCPECGEDVLKFSLYCPKCGTKLSWDYGEK